MHQNVFGSCYLHVTRNVIQWSVSSVKIGNKKQARNKKSADFCTMDTLWLPVRIRLEDRVIKAFIFFTVLIEQVKCTLQVNKSRELFAAKKISDIAWVDFNNLHDVIRAN